MIKKINLLLSNKQKFQLSLLLIIFFVNSIIEVISIGSIPVFIGYLLSPETFINNIPYESLQHHLNNFVVNKEQNTIIFTGSIIIITIFVLKNTYYFLAYYFEVNVSKNIILKINKDLFNYYLNAPYEMHLLTNPSYIFRNLMSSNTAANQIIVLIRFIREILIISGIIFIIIFVKFDITTLILVSLFLLIAFIFLFISNIAKKKGRDNSIYQSEIIKNINQFLGSFTEIKTKGKESFFLNKYSDVINKYESNNLFINMLKILPKIFLEVIAASGLLLIVFIYSQNYSISNIIPYLALITLGVIRIMPSANSIMSIITDIKFQKIYFDIVYSELEKSKNLKTNKEKLKSIKFQEIKDNIVLKNVNFNYKNTDKSSIKNINLTISSGDKVGIIGKSGSGKSTLLKIILGLLKPQKGNIIIDNKIIDTKDTIIWKNLSYVPQDPYILDDTIKNNIAFGSSNEKIDESLFEKVISCCELKDFVSNSKDNLDTYLGDRGIRMSGGQKQRLSIARALYSKPSVLFLDEATNNLDVMTEDKVLQNLKDFSEDMTIIAISHKHNTFENYDKIIELDNGEIV